MTASALDQKPKLRSLDTRPVRHQGGSYLLLRDPLALSGDTLLVPQTLAPILPLLDGTRLPNEVCVALAVRYGLDIPLETVVEVVAALDDAFLLENDRATALMEEAHAAYLDQPFRPPALADSVYPADPSDLSAYLGGFLDEAKPLPHHPPPQTLCGLLSPHIDYDRGGAIYASVWGPALERLQAADMVVILGTDHQAPSPSWTLTRQHYATPYGVLPTDQSAIDWMAAGEGHDIFFTDELHHRQEHSIELAAVWLHFMRAGKPCNLIPVLCGSFSDFVQGERDPATDPMLLQAVRRLKEYCAGKSTVIVAAGDLSHRGPAFGGSPLGTVQKAQLKASDDRLIEQICEGDSLGFYGEIQGVFDRNNVCGLAPIFLALHLMGPVAGMPTGYALCPADEAGTSVVSICGVVFQDQLPANGTAGLTDLSGR